MLSFRKFCAFAMAFAMCFLTIMPVSAEEASVSELVASRTYYEVDWDGANKNVINMNDDVYIDVYYSFSLKDIITTATSTDIEDLVEIKQYEATIGADSFFVPRNSYGSTLLVDFDEELSSSKNLVIKVSHGTKQSFALRYLGNGAAYSIDGYVEAEINGNDYILSLDRSIAIVETNTIEDKNDFSKDAYAIGYTLVGEDVNKNSLFNVGINVVDPNFVYSSMKDKVFDKSFAILTGNTFGGSNLQGYISDVRKDSMGYLMYTVWFEDIRYLNDGPLEFSVSYNFMYTEDGKSYNVDQTKKVSTTIYELVGNTSSSSFIPNVIINNYTGQDGFVAGKELRLEVDFRNTNKDIDIHNVVITVDGGNTFQQTKGVNKFFVDTIEAQSDAKIVLNITCPKTTSPGSYPIDFDIEYQYVSGGETFVKNTDGKISIPVSQTDRLQISYVKMSNVYQNNESEVNYSIINTGMSTILNAKLEIITLDGEVLGSMYLGTIDPGKEAKGSNIYLSFAESGELPLIARVSYEDNDFNAKSIEEQFTVNVMSMDMGWYEPPYIEEELPIVEEPNNSGMLGIGVACAVLVAGIGFVVYKKKKSKGVIDDEDL